MWWDEERNGHTHTHTHSLSSCRTFHVFNFIVTYLSLLRFAPWIVDRPHCGCWGHKWDNGSPLGCGVEKGTLPPGSSPDFNTDFTRLCFFTLVESVAADKRTALPHFFFLRTFSFLWLLKSTNQQGKVTFDITFLESPLWNDARVVAKVVRVWVMSFSNDLRNS